MQRILELLLDENELQWYDGGALEECFDLYKTLTQAEKKKIFKYIKKESDLAKAHYIEIISDDELLDAKNIVMKIIKKANDEHLLMTAIFYLSHKKNELTPQNKSEIIKTIENLINTSKTTNKDVLREMLEKIKQ